MALARNSLLVAILSAAPALAQAQTPVVDPAPPAPHVLRVDATRLIPGQFVYETVLERDASSTALGTRTVSEMQSTYAGMPTWLLMETRTGDAVPTVDSLFADIATLHPIHWGSSISRARLSAEFRGDTAYGGTSAPAGRRSMIVSMPPGTIVSGPMLETTLRLLPLQSAWEDSTATLSVTLNGATTLPTRLSVIGEDRVRVAAGQFDCWVVAIHAGDTARGLYWVTKTDPIVVRSAIDVPAMGGAQYVSSLVRVSPPTSVR